VKKTPLPPEQFAEVEKLENDLQNILKHNNVETNEVKKLKADIEEIVAATNPFFSEHFIKSISVPFTIKSNEAEIQSWKF